MILSMTGFGKATAVFQDKKINVEIKSLNSKTMDISMHTAPIFREKDIEIRRMITDALERGKVDFSIWIETSENTMATPINATLVNEYYKQIKNISAKYSIPEPDDWYSLLLRMPDVTARTEEETLSDEEWEITLKAISQAITALVEFRKQEGLALQQKLLEKIENIGKLLAQIEPYEKQRIEKIRARIIEGLKSIPEVDYDKNRMEQELIYYIEKLDINEEKQRLTNHLKYFTETMADSCSQGKKLGFIAQEMGREINTTGSKSNNAEMQNLVVMMKDELEQIKEQVLNVM